MTAAQLWTGLQGRGLMLTTPEPPPGSTGTFQNLAPSSLGCPVLLKLSPSPKRHPQGPKKSCGYKHRAESAARSSRKQPRTTATTSHITQTTQSLGTRTHQQTGRERAAAPQNIPPTHQAFSPGRPHALACLGQSWRTRVSTATTSEPSSLHELNGASSTPASHAFLERVHSLPADTVFIWNSANNL